MAYLLLTLLVEGERVHAVGDRIPYEWEPVEDERRLGFPPREELAKDIEEDDGKEASDGVDTEAHNGTRVHQL